MSIEIVAIILGVVAVSEAIALGWLLKDRSHLASQLAIAGETLAEVTDKVIGDPNLDELLTEEVPDEYGNYRLGGDDDVDVDNDVDANADVSDLKIPDWARDDR